MPFSAGTQAAQVDLAEKEPREYPLLQPPPNLLLGLPKDLSHLKSEQFTQVLSWAENIS